MPHKFIGILKYHTVTCDWDNLTIAWSVSSGGISERFETGIDTPVVREYG
jgi:hypothetical protein